MLFSCTPEKQGLLVINANIKKKKNSTLVFCDIDSYLVFFKLSFSDSLPGICCAMPCVLSSQFPGNNMWSSNLLIRLQHFCFFDS